MALTHAQLYPVVLDYLRSRPKGSLNLFGETFFADRCRQLGLQYSEEDDCLVQEIFHELYREGIIVTGAGPKAGNAQMEWPWYRITDYGKKAIATQEYVPHDPHGYLAQLKERIPDVDDTVIMYLDEALQCFRSQHLFAAAVMLGCAAEKALLQVIESFGSALKNPTEKAKYNKEVSSWIISQKYKALWKRLDDKQQSLPAPLTDDLHVVLDRVFDLIRATRNEAGHPTGKRLDVDTVRANFILFPVYCRRIYALLEYFKKNTI